MKKIKKDTGDEKNFFLKEIVAKKHECKNILKELQALNSLLEEDIEELNKLMEEVDIDDDILNIPKFKGQVVFEKYLAKIKNKTMKGKIKDKKKIRGIIEKNDMLKIQKDINKLKHIVNNK